MPLPAVAAGSAKPPVPPATKRSPTGGEAVDAFSGGVELGLRLRLEEVKL